MKVHEVVEAFVRGETGKASSLTAMKTGDVTWLYSYDYILAVRWPDGKVDINTGNSGTKIEDTGASWQSRSYEGADYRIGGKPGYEGKDAAFSMTTNRHRQMVMNEAHRIVGGINITLRPFPNGATPETVAVALNI